MKPTTEDSAMKLLVLAGGFGTRLRSVVAEVPKALAPVGNVPFLHIQIEHWIDQGVKSFVFLLYYQSELIVDFLEREREGLLDNCEVQWLIEPTPMDTGGAIAHAVEQLNLSDNFLVTNADTWLSTGIKEIWEAAAPAMAVVKVRDAERYGSVQFDEKNVISAFHEKSATAGTGWINAGLCHLHAESFKNWNHEPFSLERDRFVSWTAQGNFGAIPLESNFIDIGVPDDYFRFCRWIDSQKAGAL